MKLVPYSASTRIGCHYIKVPQPTWRLGFVHPWIILRTRRSGVRILIGCKILLPLPETADCLWGLPSLLFKRNAGSFWGINQVGRLFDHLTLYSAEVKNEWSSSFTPLICFHGVDRDFTFLYGFGILLFLLVAPDPLYNVLCLGYVMHILYLYRPLLWISIGQVHFVSARGNNFGSRCKFCPLLQWPVPFISTKFIIPCVGLSGKRICKNCLCKTWLRAVQLDGWLQC
jgi:hypothetical protein